MNAMGKQSEAATRLGRLLRPRTLAVFGGHAAAQLVQQAAKIGYPGTIWPVHPRHASVAGTRAFRSVADLPGIPDAAFIGVNRHASIDVAHELAEAGCGGAVAYASGYAEAGEEGRALQARLREAAGAMPFFGPNCYGFLNYFDRCLIWPDQFGGAPVARGVAIITQSGNIGLNITMQKRGLPIGYLITLGNQAGLGHAATLEAVLHDPRVSAIGLHIEGIDDPHGFAAAIARARAQNVPVVALKTGRSDAGAQIALSHTASLAGSDRVADAFFRRIGVARVDSIPALLETLKLLHVHGTLPGRRIASLSCSGGEAALMADAAAEAGVAFATLSPARHAAIAATLPELVAVSNPLDYHTFGWRDRSAMAATFAAMMRAGADLTLLVLDFPRADRCDPADWEIAAAALVDAAGQTGARAAILATLPDAMPEEQAISLLQAGILPLCGVSEAMLAIEAAADCGGFADLPAFAPLPSAPAVGHARLIAEWQGKRQLAAFGVPVPDGAPCESADEAIAVAERIGYPVVAKATGGDLAHKTEQGAVALNLRDPGTLRDAAASLLKLTGSILVERMITGTVAELIVGIARDPALGLYLVLGSGGVLAELVGDTAILLLPAAPAEVENALMGLRVARRLRGFRGAAAGDVPAAIDAVMSIQAFALAHAGGIEELDVNPLMVRAAGGGAVAADVLLRLAPEPAHG
jgi:acyl-CoA synthetase (NDP forming)